MFLEDLYLMLILGLYVVRQPGEALRSKRKGLHLFHNNAFVLLKNEMPYVTNWYF